MNKKTKDEIMQKILKEKVLLTPNKKYSDELNQFIEEANDIIINYSIPTAINLTAKEYEKKIKKKERDIVRMNLKLAEKDKEIKQLQDTLELEKQASVQRCKNCKQTAQKIRELFEYLNSVDFYNDKLSDGCQCEEVIIDKIKNRFPEVRDEK